MIIYQPFQSPIGDTRDTILHFLKIPNPSAFKTHRPISYDDEEDPRREPMRAIHDLNGYSTVFLSGDAPIFIIKSASSPPQLISFREDSVQSLSRLNTSTCDRGFAYIDQPVSQNVYSILSDRYNRLIQLGQYHLRQTAGRLPLSYWLGHEKNHIWRRRSRDRLPRTLKILYLGHQPESRLQITRRRNTSRMECRM